MDTVSQDMSPAKFREAFIDGLIDVLRVNPIEITCLLRVAVTKQDTKFATAILDQVPDILQHDDGGGKILWQALESGNEILARKLIFAGADLTYRSRNGSSFLHSFMARHQSLVALMIERGADINVTDNAGHSVLYAAVRDGLRAVVDAIARLDIRYEDENRILCDAALSDYAADLLPSLIRSSDAATRRARVKKALHRYLEIRLRDRIDMSLVKMLIDAALLPNHTETDVVEILGTIVAFRDHVKVAKLVLDCVEKLNGESADVAALLCATAKFQHSTLSIMLIQKGAKVNRCNREGEYPLHFACFNRSMQNLHLLLSLGADLTVVDGRGRTPFSYLASDSFREQHKLVLRHLAIVSLRKACVGANDLAKINRHARMKTYYEDCLTELWSMRRTRICDDVTFDCFFTKKLEDLCALTRNVVFSRTYYLNQKDRSVSFPNYSMQMHNLFMMAVERKNAMIDAERVYEVAAMHGPPYGPLDRMVPDLSDPDDFERKFFFKLHERVNNAKDRNYGVQMLH